jgi:hypothetical protein
VNVLLPKDLSIPPLGQARSVGFLSVDMSLSHKTLAWTAYCFDNEWTQTLSQLELDPLALLNEMEVRIFLAHMDVSLSDDAPLREMYLSGIQASIPRFSFRRTFESDWSAARKLTRIAKRSLNTELPSFSKSHLDLSLRAIWPENPNTLNLALRPDDSQSLSTSELSRLHQIALFVKLIALTKKLFSVLATQMNVTSADVDWNLDEHDLSPSHLIF